MFGFLLDLLSGEKRLSKEETEAVIESARRMTDVINESIEIAAKTKNRSTRAARIRVAKDTLLELRGLCRQFEFLSLPNLDDVEVTLIRLEHLQG